MCDHIRPGIYLTRFFEVEFIILSLSLLSITQLLGTPFMLLQLLCFGLLMQDPFFSQMVCDDDQEANSYRCIYKRYFGVKSSLTQENNREFNKSKCHNKLDIHFLEFNRDQCTTLTVSIALYTYCVSIK